MNDIIEILKNIKPDVDFTKEDNLIEDEILTSFDIITVIAMLKNKFNVDITVKDIVPENFASAKTMYDMIQRLKK